MKMERITFEEIVKAVAGEVVIDRQPMVFSGVSTDTRKIKDGNIFIALKGEIFNGNDYIPEASEKGAALCIVDEIKYEEDMLQAFTSVILVKDARRALLDLAKYYRSKLSLKVVGITGSTGKTSTKDLVAAAIGARKKVFKTKGNYNNDIGLPLMIFELDQSYEVAVLEMGMNHLGEIHRLAEVAAPDIAMITNVGISHIENLKTRKNILKAKMEITDFFHSGNALIVNYDNDLLRTIDKVPYKLLKVSTEEQAAYTAESINLQEEAVSFSVSGENSSFRFEIPVPGKHNVSNALLAIACAKELGITFEEINEGFRNLEFTSMRLDIIRTESYTILNDCYNASPDSMVAAIDVLCNLQGDRKIVVLGTMKELGEEAYEAHKKVGAYAKEKGVDILVAVGDFKKAYEDGYGSSKGFQGFEESSEAVKYLHMTLKEKDAVLVKASRTMKFENIVKELQIKNG